MTQPGYQEGGEPMWWWKVARHLDEAQLALANAMAHNLDDQRPVFALQDRLREGQAILLEIFRMKGLLPGATNGTAGVPMPGTAGVPMPGTPGMPMPGVPMPIVPVPVGADDVGAVPSAEQAPPLAAEEPAVPEADQAVAASEPEQPAAVSSPEAAGPAVITPPVPTVAPQADPRSGGAGG